MFNKEIIQRTAEILLRKNHTIAVAESVTAGLLQAAFASAENASFFFQGGITAYNLNQKYTHLHIDVANALSTNCVSEQTAREMALAVAQTFSSDWGIAITGYSSPLPGHQNTELYAWYAIVFEHSCIATGTIISPVKDPLEVQIFYTDQIMVELSKRLVHVNNKLV